MTVPNGPADKPMTYKLRRMRRSDVPEVLALEQRIFPTPWTQKSYEFELERNPASEQWVIETVSEAQLVAYSVCWTLGDEIHIANIAVAPRFRRRGLGRRLLAHVLHRAVAKGLLSATLEVRASNLAAQAMYAGFGFIEIGRRKRYYSDNHEDALLMQLPRLDTTRVVAELDARLEGS